MSILRLDDDGAEVKTVVSHSGNEYANAAAKIASTAYDLACADGLDTSAARHITFEELAYEYNATNIPEFKKYILAFMCIVRGATPRGNA